MLDFVPIAAEQLNQFDHEGYLIVRRAIDAETVSMIIEAGLID